MPPKKSVAEPKPAKSAAISIWATPKDREMYKDVAQRSGESLSKLVRVLIRNYNRTGKADGLPTMAKAKKAKKTKAA